MKIWDSDYKCTIPNTVAIQLLMPKHQKCLNTDFSVSGIQMLLPPKYKAFQSAIQEMT